jgi:hypothetical protein
VELPLLTQQVAKVMMMQMMEVVRVMVKQMMEVVMVRVQDLIPNLTTKINQHVILMILIVLLNLKDLQLPLLTHVLQLPLLTMAPL